MHEHQINSESLSFAEQSLVPTRPLTETKREAEVRRKKAREDLNRLELEDPTETQ